MRQMSHGQLDSAVQNGWDHKNWVEAKAAAEELVRREQEQAAEATVYVDEEGLQRLAAWFSNNGRGRGYFSGFTVKRSATPNNPIEVRLQKSALRLAAHSLFSYALHYTGPEPKVHVYTTPQLADHAENGRGFGARTGQPGVSGGGYPGWLTEGFLVPITRVEVDTADGSRNGDRHLVIKGGAPLKRIAGRDMEQAQTPADWASKFASLEEVADALYEAWIDDKWEEAAALAARALELEQEAACKAEEKRLEAEELGRKVQGFREAGAEVIVTVYTDPDGYMCNQMGVTFNAAVKPGQVNSKFVIPVQVDIERFGYSNDELEGHVRVTAKQ